MNACACGRSTRKDMCNHCSGRATDGVWDTRDELTYVRTIAGGSQLGIAWYSGTEMLRSYIAAARLRTVWDGMDRERVMQEAEHLLRLKEMGA